MVKRGRIIAFFLLVLLIGSTIGTTISGITERIKLGLDLQGGFEVLYEVSPAKVGDVIDREAMLSTVEALNRRVNVLGVSEPNIQIEGEDRIRVQLAGIENQSEAREILSTEANLTFRDVFDKQLLDGSDLVQGGAKQTFDPNTNAPIVALKLKDAARFKEVTEHILSLAPNNLMVIWLDFEEGVSSYQTNPNDPKIISAASVRQVFNQTDVVIEGNFTIEEAAQLADLLNAGALPVKLTEVYSTSVGAKLGEQAMQSTIFAGFIGIAIIFLFMILYYRLPGLVATITLSLYIYVVLLVFDWMNGVLTLPGIAALILGVGMAVDANIITYERIKDELKLGKTTMSAFRAGSRRSLSTILDANITTLLAAGVLFAYGTSSVQGFATMLILSILASFLTSVYASRLFLGLLVNSRWLNNKPGLFGVKKSDILDIATVTDDTEVPTKFSNWDFVKRRKLFFIISSSMVVLGIIVIAIFRLNLGIDFASGTRIEILANDTVTAEEIKQEFNALNIETKDIFLSGTNNEIGVARLLGVLDQGEIAKVKDHFATLYGAEPNISTVSPTVGKELAKNAFIAIMIASVGIIIYVTIRFEIYFALASIVALLHDAFFIIVLFSITRLEVDLTFIAAVLTIVGYSINDTIVTFDRIRENLARKKRIKSFDELADIVNKSLQQTMVRSFNTVLTVVFAIIALIIFGSSSILNFSVALLIGLISGTYSSLFIAAQLWLVWKGQQLKRKGVLKVGKSEPKEPRPEEVV
ncbi:protein translocase subunit SecDF [Bacillus sp. HMF5848]|uniref:protein translocase subunit SecDF n=1 Tax=Bacillus sp. HMF5848 TaxID=2495421 RepID=UPI000F77A3D1|nr:protein translocase subunit SecDF [Bacillus sp. HMF5848]RSK27989.1 protein translocase subunit SecDF [Bacillus sp. HMF5848]